MRDEPLFSRIGELGVSDAIVWNDRAYSYNWLNEAVARASSELDSADIMPGSVVALEAEFQPYAVAMFLALMRRSCVIVPLTAEFQQHRDDLLDIAECNVSLRIDAADNSSVGILPREPSHGIYRILRDRGSAGLVLFSSGSTGKPKAAVHDLRPLLRKFDVRRQKLRTITFLLYDHIGGINTLLYTLSNGGCMVTVPDRRPDTVLATAARWNVELLPTSPTFLNLMLISGALNRHQIPSLKLITYGTEPMPEATLKALAKALPNVQLQQTYGLSELGILRSKSRANDSMWMRVGGEGFELRVVDNILQIKTESAMLGYLNAPSPFTDDGWFVTSDIVEVDGEWIRILGRDSDLINVGGEKVYPAEVENVIQQMDNVLDVSVYGEANALTGMMVVARVILQEPEERRAFTRRLKQHCRNRLAPYKVPARVVLSDAPVHNARFKKMRRIT